MQNNDLCQKITLYCVIFFSFVAVVGMYGMYLEGAQVWSGNSPVEVVSKSDVGTEEKTKEHKKEKPNAMEISFPIFESTVTVSLPYSIFTVMLLAGLVGMVFMAIKMPAVLQSTSGTQEQKAEAALYKGVIPPPPLSANERVRISVPVWLVMKAMRKL